jgi:hypothetical protein
MGLEAMKPLINQLSLEEKVEFQIAAVEINLNPY